MYPKTNRIGAVIGATALLAGCLAACDAAGSTKAGAQSAPVTLRIGTDDTPGRPSEGQITEFASQVAQLSGGSITIEPVWQAGGTAGSPDWDQVVARMVVDGELDMGLIPARAWDTEGVTTLRALHAPFLVDSQALLTQVVSGDLADGMLTGLQADGVTGLALLPEGLRHLFVFADGKSIADIEGRSVRAPTSTTTEAMFTALGATVNSYSGATYRTGVSDGSIFAADSGFPLAGNLPAVATVESDVVLFPKVNTLVIDNDALAELSDQQQDILRRAAAATLTWSIGAMQTEDAGAQQFCADGGTVAHAPDGEVAGLLTATAPVYAMLEQDPTTKQQLDAITALKATLPAPVPAAVCGPVAERSSTPPEPDVSIDGVWRQDVSAEYLISAGLTPAKAEEEAGVQTYTLQGGVLTLEYGDIHCTGTYAINGSRVTITGTTGCHFATAMTAAVADDQITWTDAESLPPYTAPADQNEARAFAGVPWTKVGDVAAPAADFPQGSYRAEITHDALVAAGVDGATATEHAGIWTLTFDNGALTVDDVNAASGNRSHGTGVYCVADGRVSMGQLGTPPACGDFWNAEWTADADQLRFVDVQSDSGYQTLIATLFGSVPFTRVG